MICTGPVFLLFFFKKKLSRRELPVPVKCCTHHDADSLFHQLKGHSSFWGPEGITKNTLASNEFPSSLQ